MCSPIVVNILSPPIVYFQTSLDDILNLSAFACEDVVMQFGVINKFGEAKASFTDVTSRTVEVYGGKCITIDWTIRTATTIVVHIMLCSRANKHSKQHMI